METILANGFNWLTKYVPGLAFVIFLMITVAWMSFKINDFEHRIAETERVCSDINTRQLPEIRSEIKEMKVEMDRRFSEIDKRLTKIELQLTTIVTYIETKEGLKPKFP